MSIVIVEKVARPPAPAGRGEEHKKRNSGDPLLRDAEVLVARKLLIFGDCFMITYSYSNANDF